MSDYGNILLVALGIGLLIYIHELGHYMAARAIGVRVEVFSLGFGPRLCGFRKGPTDYRLSLIPLGGYVAIAGMEPGDNRYPPSASLHGKTVGQRFLFYSGGVIMNLLFALVAFPIAFGNGVGFLAPEIGDVQPGSAAWEARLQPGDEVLSIDGKAMYSFDNLAVEIALAGNAPVDLEIRRGEEVLEVTAWPQKNTSRGLFELGCAPALADKLPRLNIARDGAAYAAGLRDEDELVAINNQRVDLSDDLTELVTELDGRSDAPVTVRIRRNGEEQDFTIEPLASTAEPTPILGVKPMPRIVGGIRNGLPMLRDLGLERGDVVLQIDGVALRSGDLSAAKTGGSTLTMVVRRNSRDLQLEASVTPRDRELLDEHVALIADLTDTVLEPVPAGRALAAGIQGGDRLLAINGQPLRSWDDLRENILDSTTETLQLEVERPAAVAGMPPEQLSMAVQPDRRQIFDYGLVPTSERKRTEVRAEGFADAVRLGFVCSLDLIKQLYITLKRLVTGEVAAKNLGGIIQISRVSYHNAQWGFSRLLYFLALLSINLAFINVLPIPVLDGGHLAFLLIEKIKGSPVSARVMGYSQILGLVFVLALVVFVTYNDILRLL
ncbi:MAG: RIP metalloprotease RseP [Planctomycetota bacterium]|nr:RIP metalloprotease RseP [Planctomycetota bacterium]